MTAAAPHCFAEIVVDFLYRPSVPRPAPAELSKKQSAARLQLIQRKRGRDAAEEAEFILRFADLCPDTDDPPPDHPGAKKTYWRTAAEFPGVSEFFLDELGAVLNVGRGTAAFRARRAFCWRDGLPATFAALKRGDIDERRAQELFVVLEHAPLELARRIEATLLPEAAELSVAKLGNRARELLLELDAGAAEDRRKAAEDAADVFVQPKADGVSTVGCDLPNDEAAEIESLIDEAAKLAKADGDPRPIRQIRREIFSLLLRRPGALAGVQATLTITATLESLEGSSTAPADVNGFAITPAQLTDLLRRVAAVGLHTPQGGSLTFGLFDEHGRLISTLSKADLERLVNRGDGLNPPAATDRYQPTGAQRRFIRTRDRHCRMPNCGARTGWADHDHVVPHSCGGETTCTNLCCLCRSHHRLKTFAKGWIFVMEDDGTLHVTTPSGVTRTTRPWALRRPPPSEPPPDDPPPF
jgi:hypothetical protein